MKDSNRIKIGIAGLGRSGWNIHVPLLEQLDDLYQISAVFDVDENRRKEAKNRLNCNLHSTFQALISDRSIEVVLVATPTHLHAKQSIQALKAGKHVVCEKPMAPNLQDGHSMARVSRGTGRILTVFQNCRYNPDFLKVKEICDSGILGRIILIRRVEHLFRRRWDWQTLKKFGGGALNNSGAHFVDQALLLFGPETPEVFSQMGKILTLGDAEDHVKIILKAK